MSSPQSFDLLSDQRAARSEGLRLLNAFLDEGLVQYSQLRNFDYGPDARQNVSNLSPFIRLRLITEEEVVRAALARHPFSKIEKFVQEIFWRTYWKGWLELRPAVWQDWLKRVAEDREAVESNSGWHTAWLNATEGRTGIECFDSWVSEIKSHNTLHNHTRMWFASIWIFTLRLPWSLGALFFWQHLLDGDPASNTLSWRWVGGLQTQGKHYVARASNIARFTDNRFFPKDELNENPEPLEWDNPPAAGNLDDSFPLKTPTGKWALYLHEEDLSPDTLEAFKDNPPVAIIARQPHWPDRLPVSQAVQAFRTSALYAALNRLANEWEGVGKVPAIWLEKSPSETFWEDLAKETDISSVVSLYCPVGEVAGEITGAIEGCPFPWVVIRRPYDTFTWPHSTKGFFRFKQAIPKFISSL